jgi:hypothetical protein
MGVVGTVELLYSIFLVYICPWFDSGSGTARMANQYTIRLVANETFSFTVPLVLLETASTLTSGISWRMPQGDMFETRIKGVKSSAIARVLEGFRPEGAG